VTSLFAARPRSRTVALVAVLAVLFGVFLEVVLGATPASAHAVVVSSSPADGSTVRTAPTSVSITFDETVQLVPGTARVLSTTGARIDDGRAHLTSRGNGIVIPLSSTVRKGRYLVTWRVVSADTHIVSGSIAFGVRERASTSDTGTGSALTSLDVAADAAQGFSYIGVILAFGVGAAGALLWTSSLRTKRSRALRTVGVAFLAVGALVEFLLQGPRAAESGWGGVLRFTDVGQTMASTYGAALLVRCIAVLAVAPLTVGRLASRRARSVAFAAALVVLVTIALAGHAGTGSEAWLAILAAVLHLSGMAVWLGGLATLVVIVLPRLRRAKRLPLRALRMWSTTAFIAVAVLIVSGEYQGWREVRPLPALWDTPYGVVLLIKLGLVLIALLTALVPQRILLRSRPGNGRPGLLSWGTLRRAVVIESVVTTAVVAATTVLVSLPPASATYGPPETLSAPLGASDRLIVHLDTTMHGPERMSVRAVDRNGRDIRLQDLDATLSSRSNGVSALSIRLVRSSDGTWRSNGMVVPLTGQWTLTFDASVDQATGYATRTEYTAW
jgi:copper transport protein